MLKFFRKYNKWILAVGGTLLMITFLIPQAIQGLSQAGAFRTAKWASYTSPNNKSVTLSLADRDKIQRQMKLLDELNPAVLRSFGVQTPEHWFLLVHEADQAGLIGGHSDGARYIPEPREELLAMLRDRTGEHPQFILETCANVRGVTRLQSEWVNAPQFSDRRLKAAAKRLYHNANGNMVVIKADTPEQAFAPTEEEIRQQFDKYKDTNPAEGEKGFGYKLPNRVKLEWIEVPVASVRAMIERSDAMNGVELRKHWSKHASRLGIDPPAGGGAVPQVVRDDLLEELLSQKLQEISKFGGDELDAAERGLARQGGYLVLPDDWSQRQPSLEHLAQRIQQQFEIELPAYHAIGDRWLTIEDVAKLDGIGEASTMQFGQVPTALPDLVSREKAFSDNSTIAIQKGIAGPPLSGPDGSIYIFRILDADASRAPVSIDEVREQIVKDLGREAHFAELLARQDELRSAAIDMGLLRFAMANNTAVHPSGLITERMQPSMPEIGYVESVVKAIIDKALQLPPGVAVADMTSDMKTLVVPVEDKLAILVYEITSSNPLTEETYRTIASPTQNPSMPQLSSSTGQLQTTLRSKEIENGQLALKAFEYDTIAKRHNFQVIGTQMDAEAEAEASDATDDSGSDAPAKATSG